MPGYHLWSQACGSISLVPQIGGQAIDTLKGNNWQDGRCTIHKLEYYAYWDDGDSVRAKDIQLFKLSRVSWNVSISSQGQLMLGVDSALNDAGVHPGDLDPVHGMYWSWQTGYIHLKLEGELELPGQVKQSFVYHIGGFTRPTSGPFLMSQITELNQYHFVLDISSALQWAFDQDLYRIMSPGLKSEAFAHQILNGFKQI